jgi:hypothetical protein
MAATKSRVTRVANDRGLAQEFRITDHSNEVGEGSLTTTDRCRATCQHDIIPVYQI